MKRKVILKILFTIISIAIGSLCITTTLKAIDATRVDNNYSWSNGSPYVFSSTPIPGISSGSCETPYRYIEIDGETGQKRACIVSYENGVAIGSYYGPGMRRIVTIGFNYSDKMYPFNISCEKYDSCIFVPQNDILITKQNILNNSVRALVVYKNFSKRIKPILNSIKISFDFDYSNPDYTFKSKDGYPWPINGAGVSSDGDWLAVEFVGRGVGMINLNSFEIKRISQIKLSYGQGRNAKPEIAVSKGGNHVALMGSNTPLRIYDVTSSCGDIVDDYMMWSDAQSKNNCHEADVDTRDFIDRFSYGIYPKFDESGGELRFYASSYTEGMREVILRASEYISKQIDYLALGDSFSSGEGETEDSHYLYGTNELHEKCHVSDRSYPFLVANLQGINSEAVENIACSGATMEDVVGGGDSYFGQRLRLGENGLKLSLGDITLARSLAQEYFIPGRVHQQRFIERYKPGVVTIGIGGNDAKIVGKLSACIGPGTCDWVSNPQKKEQTAIEIQNLFPKLVNTYTKLHNDSANSKLYAVGYPKSVNPAGDCGSVIDNLLDYDERVFMNESIKYINQIVEAAAKSAGVGYIDIYDAFGGQVMCGSKDPIAMNDIRFGDDINFGWVFNIGNESFHPNPTGHRLIADTINSSIGSILSDSYCENDQTICPNASVTAPEPSIYWIPEGVHNYRKLIAKSYLNGDDSDDLSKNISIEKYSFAPSSEVQIMMTSEPLSLGIYESDLSGGLNVSINLPSDIEEGYHTIHLLGTSYLGDLIDIYQIIKYIKPIEIVIKEPLQVETEEQTQVDITNATQQEANIVAEINIQDEVKTNVTNIKKVSKSSENIAYLVKPKVDNTSETEPVVKGAMSVGNEPRGSNASDIKILPDNGNILSVAACIILGLVLGAFGLVYLKKTVNRTNLW